VLPPERKRLIHPYTDPLDTLVTCAALEEILAEKYVAMCAVAMQQERQERVFTRPRDYFDLCHALNKNALTNKEDFLAAVLIKAERRGTKIRSMSELASLSSMAALERDWKPFLGDVVSNLADCQQTLEALERKMQDLFPNFPKNLAYSKPRAMKLNHKSRGN
jgi:predicted nucleotidyltransferase component of viral defense system